VRWGVVILSLDTSALFRPISKKFQVGEGCCNPLQEVYHNYISGQAEKIQKIKKIKKFIDFF